MVSRLLILMTALTMASPALHAAEAPPSDGVVVIRNGEASPPTREATESVNRAVKNRKARLRADGTPETEGERAPVYRSLADAAADGVGIRPHSAGSLEDTASFTWTWWRIAGAFLGGLLTLGAGLGVYGWWRSR